MNTCHHSIGIDIIKVERFSLLVQKEHFLNKIFTTKEIAYCKMKKTKEMLQSFAARFAAKEAVMKSLNEIVEYNEIEIISDSTGRPMVNFLNDTIRAKYKTNISLSHSQEFAVASCLTFYRDTN